MMLASGAPPDGMPSSVALSSRAHLDGGLALSIPCTTSPMFPGMLKLDKSVYSSPPPAPNIPENNVCKLIEYRGHKVASFNVQRRELICLPQAFELFLKNLVGGLHTVYTKLKRLGIMPVVCNVEQVRILRGLGAIQPGVNRCKLIAPKEFDVLYDDCTNSSARPGRPPKRGSPSPMKEEADMNPFRPKQSRLEADIPGYSPYKWMDLMKTSPLFGNGYYYPPQMAAHLPFMPHPAQMMSMAAIGAGHLPHNRTNGLHEAAPKDLSNSPMKDMSHLERINTQRVLHRSKIEELIMQREKNNNTAPPPPPPSAPHGGPHGNSLSRHSAEIPLNLNTRDAIRRASIDDSGASSDHDDISDTEVDLSSPSGSYSEIDADSRHAINDSDTPRPHLFMRPPPPTSNVESGPPPVPSGTPSSGLPPPPHPPPSHDLPEAGSMVALLMNVQGLLRMAIESAKHRETKIQTEKDDLKREMSHEREKRQHLEVQLADTQNTIMSLQRKLKKEKKLLRRLNETMLQAQNLPSIPQYPHINSTNNQTPQQQHCGNKQQQANSNEHSILGNGRCTERNEASSASELRSDVIRTNGVEHRDSVVTSEMKLAPSGLNSELINGRMSPEPKEESREHETNDV